jgi:hypothetical protein
MLPENNKRPRELESVKTIDLIVELSSINSFLNREHTLLRKMTFIKSDWEFRENVENKRRKIVNELNIRN